ncbi:MAG: hypothetical protein ACOYM5_04550 [Caulobacter sp.]|jgi:DNA-binding phage protein
MAIETTPFDAALVLNTAEAVEEYLADALESGDAAVIAQAREVVSRIEGSRGADGKMS